MSATMHVVLKGSPERTQEAADVLDRAFPGVMNWSNLAKQGRDHSMRLEGVAVPQDEAQRPPAQIISPSNTGKPWKLSSLTMRESHQGIRFCTSFRSCQP